MNALPSAIDQVPFVQQVVNLAKQLTEAKNDNEELETLLIESVRSFNNFIEDNSDG
jgi:hypothetical protein